MVSGLELVAAVGLPIWIHLLKRHRTDPRLFPSLMLFEKREQSSVKHRRLEHLLLFALRALMILLIALLFANPFIRRTVSAKDSKKLTVIAVDRSFSMRAGARVAASQRRSTERVIESRAGRSGAGGRAGCASPGVDAADLRHGSASRRHQFHPAERQPRVFRRDRALYANARRVDQNADRAAFGERSAKVGNARIRRRALRSEHKSGAASKIGKVALQLDGRECGCAEAYLRSQDE